MVKVSNKDYRTSLTGRMWIVILILSAVCVVAFLLFTNIESEITEKTNATALINSIADSIHSEIGTYEDISRLIMVQADVVKYLRSGWNNPDLKYNARLGIMDVLNACSYIDSVFVIRNDGGFVSTGHGNYYLASEILKRDRWPEVILKGRGKAITLINGDRLVYREDGSNIITIGRVIYDIDSQEQTGLLFMNISASMLSHLEKASESSICICTTDGIPLAGDAKVLDGVDIQRFTEEISHIKTGPARFISGLRMRDNRLIIICRSKVNIADVPRDILLTMAFALLVFIICFFTLGAFLSKNITVPVRAFTEEIEKSADSGELQKVTAQMPDNEIGMLSDSYNSMIDHINELSVKQRNNEKEMQRAEIRVLQEQIKPHFLYNALETIGGIAIEEGSENVRYAVETLGNFYRNFLSNGAREIELRREITIIRNYITMQKLRYGEILSEEYDIAEDTLDCLVPKLILQPLVENSINHGARLKGEVVRIKISAWQEQGYVHLVVYDSGLGMSESTIQKCMKKEKVSNKGGGFGLEETVTRISYYNKENDAIQIRSEEGEFTEIEIKLPYKTALTEGGEK